MHGRTNPTTSRVRPKSQHLQSATPDNARTKHQRSLHHEEGRGRCSPNTKSTVKANRKKTVQLITSSAASVGRKGAVKVFAEVLNANVNFKTVEIFTSTTSKELVSIVLDKYGCRTKDPNLYYVAMETGIRNKDSGLPINQIVVLEDRAFPLELQESQLEGETEFHLKMRSGGLIMVRTSILTSGADFKSLYVARNTTSLEVVRLVLAGYDTEETPGNFCLREASSDFAVDRLLNDDECPLQVQAQWKTGEQCNFNLTRKVVKKDKKEENPNCTVSKQRLQRELHNRERTIEVLRQTIRHLQQGPSNQSQTKNLTGYSNAEKYGSPDDSLFVSQQHEKNETHIDIDPTKREKQNSEFSSKFTDFHHRSNASGNIAAVAVVQPTKRSKCNSSFSDFDDLDHVKAGSKRFNEPDEINENEDTFPSRKSSAGSIEKELLPVHPFPIQIHKNLSLTKTSFETLQGNVGYLGDEYTLFDVLQTKDLIAVHLIRLPGEGLGIELAQVTETRPLKNTRGENQEKGEVLYIIHNENGENVVLDKKDYSSPCESPIGFRQISTSSSPITPRSISLELDDDETESSKEQQSRKHSAENVLFQNINPSQKLNFTPPHSASPSRSNSINVQKPRHSTLPFRSSAMLAHWRSAGSPASGPGVRIVGLAEGSAAALSGNLKEDDVIVEVNGKYLLNSTLDETIATMRGSETVDIVVARQRSSLIIHPPSPFAVPENDQDKENKESTPNEETEAHSEQLLLDKLNKMQEELKRKDEKITYLRNALEKKKTNSKLHDKRKYAQTVQVMV